MGPGGRLAHVDVVVEGVQRPLQALHGHQHVLHHVVLLVQLAQGLALSQLQEGDLGRHHPAEEVAEDGVVAEGDDVLRQSLKMGGGTSKGRVSVCQAPGPRSALDTYDRVRPPIWRGVEVPGIYPVGLGLDSQLWNLQL